MNLPRFALGTIQPDADANPILWALLAHLEQLGNQVQVFRYQANFLPCDAVRAITGQGERHLDSWLMPRELCTALFEFGTQGCDLAVVEGRFDTAGQAYDTAGQAYNTAGQAYNTAGQAVQTRGGSLDTLCEWLNLPRIAVVDAGRWARCLAWTQPPSRSASFDAILLDGVRGSEEAAALATDLETLWQVPVIGYLPEAKHLRSQLTGLPRGASPTKALCQALGDALRPHLHEQKLLKLIRRPAAGEPLARPSLASNAAGERLRIAVAFDEAFQCYFPDTLDILEACGAELRAFSPLRSPELPPDTDVVYFGCGRIDRHAEALAANLCLRQSVQSFAASGGRIYAEGGGLAYLCRQIILDDGQRLPMANALPAIASRNPHPDPVQPAVVRLRRATWLGEAFQELRGYLNTAWRVTPWGTLTDLALEPERTGDLLGRRNVVGSRLHFHFAAHPQVLRCFFHPHAVSCASV